MISFLFESFNFHFLFDLELFKIKNTLQVATKNLENYIQGL